MKKLGYMLIIWGACILIYVGITRFMVYKEQKALMETITNISDQSDKSEKSPSAQTNNSSENNGALGILEIPRISLTVPIVEGSDEKALKYAVGHIPDTGSLGKTGENFCIAGHRSHNTYGRFFNRLNELQENDDFSIKSEGKVFNYKVFKKIVVSPDQIEVLEPQGDKSIVTLITCHPLYSNKQRLVVYGELVK